MLSKVYKRIIRGENNAVHDKCMWLSFPQEMKILDERKYEEAIAGVRREVEKPLVKQFEKGMPLGSIEVL